MAKDGQAKVLSNEDFEQLLSRIEGRPPFVTNQTLIEIMLLFLLVLIS